MANSGPASGFRDYAGLEAKQKRELINRLVAVYTSYGYEPLETPVVERQATLKGKGGGENEKLIYDVLAPDETTKAEATLGLRFDLTVPLARFFAQNTGMLMPRLPYRRYACGEVFRGERAQKGRYRSFTQLDADIVGERGSVADAELLSMVKAAFSAIHVPVVVRVNNRKIIDGLMEICAIPQTAQSLFTGLLDSLDKEGKEAVLTRIQNTFGNTVAAVTAEYVSLKGSEGNVLTKLAELLKNSTRAQEGINELTDTLLYMEGEEAWLAVDPTIVRGLDYYTGMVFETTLTDAPAFGSVCSGGRYDNLIQALGGPHVPAAGISIGVDRLLSALKELNALPVVESELYYVTIFSGETARYSLALAAMLRRAGKTVITAIQTGKKLSKQLADASRANATYAVIAGPVELESNQYILKNLATGEQEVKTF